MHTYIQKWGNSLGIRLPMRFAKKLHLYSGSPVTIEIEDDRIVIQIPQYDLEAMLKEDHTKKQAPSIT